MANIILFTDKSPATHLIHGSGVQFERYTRAAGAYKIASVLRAQGFSVLVVPNCLRLTFSAVKKLIDASAHELLWVGISTTFLTVRSSSVVEYRDLWRSHKDTFLDLDVLNSNHFIDLSAGAELAWGSSEVDAIAAHLKDTPLLVGGTWVTHIQNGGLNCKNKNVYIIPGNTEDYVLHLTNSLKLQGSVPLKLVEGQKDFKSSIIQYHDSDFVDPDEWLGLEISRGCAFRCAYCTYEHKGKEDTTKFTKTLRDEILSNYEKYGVTKYILLDDLYNDSEYKIKSLYDEVWNKLPFKIEWASYLRLDLIWSNPDTAEWLKESGCRLGSFGIETLHDLAGKKVGKGLGKKRIIETLQHLKSVWKDEVIVNALMIAGLPHEPYEHLIDTMTWLQTTDLVHSYRYAPLWVTPPSHKKFVLKQNLMSDDYEKYQLQWGSEGWINNQGVTFKKVSELVRDDIIRQYNEQFPVDFVEYPELRSYGYTHAQLSDKEFNKSIANNLLDHNSKINDLISKRLFNIINYVC